MDVLTCTWLIMNAACLLATFGLCFKEKLPDFLLDLMVHGKTREDERPSHSSKTSLLLVPKRWFSHFYMFGLICCAASIAILLQYIIEERINPSVKHFLSYITVANNPKLDCFSVFLTLILLFAQMSRRLYESIIVASISGKMHVGHYVIGMVFYFLVHLTVIAEIPMLTFKDWCKSHQKTSQHVLIIQLLGIVLFVWATCHQSKCHMILARLTTWTLKQKKMYKIPYGDWFDYISSPHYLAEILIYIGIFMTMKGQCFRWILVLTFVISNLTIFAHTTHSWYKLKFADYPQNRHIILPYIF